MSYKEDLYKNCLRVIEKLYTDSQYNADVDLFRSFDIINSVNQNQMASKEHLTKAIVTILPDIKKLKHIAILGSWYGLLSVMLREHISDEVYIDNIDSDPGTSSIGRRLFKHDRTHFFEGDALDHTFDKLKNYQLIINTSCEHMEQEDLTSIIKKKPGHTWVAVQTNNYVDLHSHINCWPTAQLFAESLGLKYTAYVDTLELKGFNRFMVIGK
jgi:hypothetical protein